MPAGSYVATFDAALAVDDVVTQGASTPGLAGLSVAALFQSVLRGSPLIAAMVIAGVFIGYLTLTYIPTRYTSSASIIIEPKRPGSFGADAEFANIIVDGSKIASVEVVLLSSRVLERVVRRERLADNPVFGDIKPSLIERLLPFLLVRNTPPMLDTPDSREARAIDQLRRMLRVARVGMTYVIKIDATSSDAGSAQRIAADVADAYLADQVDTKLDAAQRDSLWLQDRIAAQRSDLVHSEVAVEVIRKKLGVTGVDTGAGSTMDRHALTQISDELARAQGDVAAAGAKYSEAARLLKSGRPIDGLTDITASKVITDLRKQQAESSQALANLSTRYASQYPERAQAEQASRAIDRQISLEISRIVSGLNDDLQTAIAHRDALQQQLDRLVGTVNAASSAEGRVELREAERVADANRIAYDASLNRLREVEQQQTRQDVEARVISEAFRPDRPSFPKPALFLGGGGGLGLTCGLGFVLMMTILRARVEDPAAAERALLVPVLATTPKLQLKRLATGSAALNIPDYLAANPYSTFAESFRLLRLRTRMHRSQGGQVLQVTSAIPGEGKSTVAAGIAISAAAAGQKTVLVDLDLHRPASGPLLGGTSPFGIVDFLLGSLSSEDALEPHASLPLRIIGAGSVSALNPGMIESEQLATLINNLRIEFDIVILDTPPILAICDPLYISQLADAVILVVSWRSTPRKCVENALAALRSAGARIAGIHLNQVAPSRIKSSYGYSHDYSRNSSDLAARQH